MKKIALFGSTGSVGQATLKVLKRLKGDFCVHALANDSNIELLQKQLDEFQPRKVTVFDPQAQKELSQLYPAIDFFSGKEGLLELACDPEVDMIVMAMSGIEGLAPTLMGIEKKKSIAIASKEVIISGGSYLMRKVQENKIPFLPIDSEHNALFQCLIGEKQQSIDKMIITASGGPFFQYSVEEMRHISIQKALDHPTYRMGKKISIDSSNLMNKGLEVIEAKILFDVPLEKIEVVIHPQSIVHGIVSFVDGSMVAELHPPNMEISIQNALTYPERIKGGFSPVSMTSLSPLTFHAVDHDKFPCLSLAYEAAREGKSYPCYLNAANNVLVSRFLQGKISWHDIYRKLDQLMTLHDPIDLVDFPTISCIIEKAGKNAQTI
ncbi:MAG: 1-deoxy-D-xylulose-5-phosphate reductoisomerase [Parachlamydiales bacterium]|nr:1-deoxy-D-xylulose-5-phosphate reductoisomerase [Parachlamydiales bacterium]